MLTTVLWGLTFPVVKTALLTAPAGLFLSLRMLITAALVAVFYIILRRPLSYPFDRHGIGLIVSFAAGFLFQTYGLQYITAPRSGFFTSLYVLVVPLVAGRIAHERPPTRALRAIPLALLGAALLMNPAAGGAWNGGDWLTIACAIAFGFQIAWTSRIGRRVDAGAMLFWTSLMTGLLSLLFLPFQHHALQSAHLGASFWWGVAYTTIGGSVIALYLMNRYQPRTDVVSASLIYTLEPVFAVIFAVALFGNHLPWWEWVGGALILIANILAQFRRKAPATLHRAT